MYNKQLNTNIKSLDLQIGKLTEELIVEEKPDIYELKQERIKELTKVRCQLEESRTSSRGIDSKLVETLVAGVFGLASIGMVLKYEKEDVITSKAFGIASKLFK